MLALQIGWLYITIVLSIRYADSVFSSRSPFNASHEIKTTSVNWWFALRLKASLTGLGLKGPLKGFPFAPHSLTNSKEFRYFFLFFSPVN
ncbi:hypothetical protein, partial [Cytobacillus horneckiae]|uniref:hypothetical protein n=1 Tax=Cytobacillus horneckiae TaxID=549687 RepID=UPI003D216D5B